MTDPIRLEVLRHSLVNIVENMENGMRRTAFSILARELGDLSCTIHTGPAAGLDMVAAATGIPALAGCSHTVVRENVLEFGPDVLQPGDELVFNDPFRGGNHAQDVALARPVFHNGEIVAICCARSHWVDVGGANIGSWPSGGVVDTIFEETSLRLPPLLAFRGDVPVKSIHSLLLDGTRLPEIVLGDFMSAHTAVGIGEQRLQELIEREGIEAVKAAMQHALDHGERQMRAAIAALPDGVYEAEDEMDDDGLSMGPFPIKVTITIRGEEAEIDFSGTSRQTESNVSAPWGHAACCALLAFSSLADHTIAQNAGTYRPIDLVLPEGSLVHALPYHACVDGSAVMSARILSTIVLAMNAIRPEVAIGDFYGSPSVANISGTVDPRPGRAPTPWVLYTVGFGGFGATACGDGHSYSVVPLANAIDASTEAIEQDNPVVLLRKELTIDSAGPGEHRGGFGTTYDIGLLAPAMLQNNSDRAARSGFGAAGGKGSSRVFLESIGSFDAAIADATEVGVPLAGLYLEGGERRFHSGKFSGRPLPDRTVWRSIVPGGGGWGNPLDRDPELVRSDVVDGLVSVEGADADYGVVLGFHLDVDVEATRARRAELATDDAFGTRAGPARWEERRTPTTERGLT